jgi:hypothetical protein
MEQWFVLGIVAVTSVLAYGVVARGRAGVGLGTAVRRALELVGVATLFFTVNLAVGLLVVAGIRTLTRAFLSVYLLDDTALLALSALQGLVFANLRAGSGTAQRSAGRRPVRSERGR